MSAWSKVGIFSAGVAAGAALGFLLAPETGEEARAYLAQAVRKGVERAAEEGSKWVQRAQDAAGQVGEKVQDYTGTAREMYDRAKDVVS